MKNKAVYPGTFDPITNGHLDVIKRAGKMFDEVIVAVAKGELKQPLFSWDERIDMARQATKTMNFVKVMSYKGLLVDFLRKTGRRIVIRGLRALSDFEYEFQLALSNKKLYNDVEMIYMLPDESYLYISSSSVKEIAFHHGNINKFVPAYVAQKLRKKFNKPLE